MINIGGKPGQRFTWLVTGEHFAPREHGVKYPLCSNAAIVCVSLF